MLRLNFVGWKTQIFGVEEFMEVAFVIGPEFALCGQKEIKEELVPIMKNMHKFGLITEV